MNDYEILSEHDLVFEFSDYREFIKAIGPKDPVKNKTLPLKVPYSYGTLWRGASNLSHNLVPAALRPNNKDALVTYAGMNGGSQWLDREDWQIEYEFLALRNFFDQANTLGLQIPDEDGLIGSGGAFVDDSTPSKIDWPDKKLRPLLGLAQHHELPTRLLDWSRSHFIAAYFAASGAVSRLNEKFDEQFKTDSTVLDLVKAFPPDNIDSKLVVWTLNAGPMLIPQLGEHLKIEDLHLVGVIRHGNNHIVAQKGCFTLRTLSKDISIKDAVTDRRSLIKYTLDKRPDLLHFFKAYTLPITEAPELLIYLNSIGFSRSVIYPGYTGVVEDLKEQSSVRKLTRHYEISNS